MDDKKQYSALTIDRAAFLLLRVKKAFKKKKLQRKEREKNAQLAAARIDQRASCAGLESAGKKPPPLLRSRTLPAIVVPGVSILQAQLGNGPAAVVNEPGRNNSRFLSARVSFSRDDTVALDMRRKSSGASRANYVTERAADGTLVLRVPHARAISSSSTALYRLGKLLNQSGFNKQPSAAVADDANVVRRLSWER